jgi:site-specific DNA-cytosine methylase
MNVLSLFDGMSCGQIALDQLGIKVDNYFASEIDENAMRVTMKNYPNTRQIGDITKIKYSGNHKIGLLIGGSSCQNFSFAGTMIGMKSENDVEILTLKHYLDLKNNGFEFKGESYLFWEFIRVLKETNPKYFLLENVKMSKKWQEVISKAIGVEPILINSKVLSAHNRPRLYWTNIPIDKIEVENKQCVYDILEEDAEFNKNYAGWMLNKWGDKTRLDAFFNAKGKASCLTANMAKGQKPTYCVNDLKEIHKYTPIECERLQTVPDNYTSGVANSHRFKMLGNGWTVEVIKHIFKGLQC